MEYINFNLSVPIGAYLEIENAAMKKHVSKNEIILGAIFCHLTYEDKGSSPIKNAGFENRYNKF